MERKSQYLIRFNDCDPFNHLNNSCYFNYMLNAREDHLNQFYNLSLQEYHQKGFGWVVSSHEIIFIRPASYAEKVSIYSSLIEITEEHLLVEMIMMDENSSHIKAILWTKFSFVNLKTLQRENHSEDFMSFAESILNLKVNCKEGLANRVNNIRTELKTNEVK